MHNMHSALPGRAITNLLSRVYVCWEGQSLFVQFAQRDGRASRGIVKFQIFTSIVNKCLGVGVHPPCRIGLCCSVRWEGHTLSAQSVK